MPLLEGPQGGWEGIDDKRAAVLPGPNLCNSLLMLVFQEGPKRVQEERNVPVPTANTGGAAKVSEARGWNSRIRQSHALGSRAMRGESKPISKATTMQIPSATAAKHISGPLGVGKPEVDIEGVETGCEEQRQEVSLEVIGREFDSGTVAGRLKMESAQ